MSVYISGTESAGPSAAFAANIVTETTVSADNCDHAWNADSAGQPENCIDCGAAIDTPASAAKGEAVADYSGTVMTDAMFANAKAMREMLDRLEVRNTRYISDGALAVEFNRLQPHPTQQAGTKARARLLNDATEIRKWAADCADARTWGGPTLYPTHPIDEARASRMATDILAALTSEAKG